MPEQSAFWWDAAAVFVAFCALVLTIMNNGATRKHYRLSVTPRLSTFVQQSTSSDEDGSIYHFKVELANTGLGPAIISSFDLYVDEKPAPARTAEEMFETFKSALPADYVEAQCYMGILKRAYVMAAGERLSIAAIATRDEIGGLDEELGRFQLLVKYKSMYGETFVYDTREHQ